MKNNTVEKNITKLEDMRVVNTVYIITRQNQLSPMRPEEVYGFVDNEQDAEKIVDEYNNIESDYVYYYTKIQKINK